MHFIHAIAPGAKRVFVGIPVDKHSRKCIGKLLKTIKAPQKDIRWVAEGNWHLTLAFLGDKPISEVENLFRLFAETYQQEVPFQFNLSKLTRFPGPGGRIIALTGGSTRPMEIIFQNTVELLQRNKIEFARKEFRPHITLGRIKKAKQVRTSFFQQTDIKLDVTKIRFYQSTLTSSGSIYTVLQEAQLN